MLFVCLFVSGGCTTKCMCVCMCVSVGKAIVVERKNTITVRQPVLLLLSACGC